jgi:membrane protein YdbS with pleckstrin-like domain
MPDVRQQTARQHTLNHDHSSQGVKKKNGKVLHTVDAESVMVLIVVVVLVIIWNWIQRQSAKPPIIAGNQEALTTVGAVLVLVVTPTGMERHEHALDISFARKRLKPGGVGIGVGALFRLRIVGPPSTVTVVVL